MQHLPWRKDNTAWVWAEAFPLGLAHSPIVGGRLGASIFYHPSYLAAISLGENGQPCHTHDPLGVVHAHEVLGVVPAHENLEAECMVPLEVIGSCVANP